MHWNVYLEATAITALTNDQVDDLVDLLAPWHCGGVGTHPDDPRKWSTTLTIELTDISQVFAVVLDVKTAVEQAISGPQTFEKLELTRDTDDAAA